MSVGKESIKRAASAGTKKNQENAPVQETAGAAKTAPKKTAAKTKSSAPRKSAPKTAARTVKTAVLTPADSAELQSKFIKAEQPDEKNSPVRITEELPVYLL